MKILEKSDNFNELISKGITLVDFYADWCGPCKLMMSVLESIDSEVNIVKVNVDEFEELTSEHRIMSIPTLIFFKDGVKVNEIVGFHSKEELEKIIKEI